VNGAITVQWDREYYLYLLMSLLKADSMGSAWLMAKSKFCSKMENITKETSKITCVTRLESITTLTVIFMTVSGSMIRELVVAEFSCQKVVKLTVNSKATKLNAVSNLKTKMVT
jgi:preprotein translocase subunit SecE